MPSRRPIPDDVLPDRTILNVVPDLPATADARSDSGEGVVFRAPPGTRIPAAQGHRQRELSNALRRQALQGGI